MKFRKLLSAAILFFAAFFVRGVEVVNAGHSGWNSRQLREIFRQELDKNRPDLIILMVGTNDNLNSYNLVPPEEFEKNLTAMAESARASGAELLLCEIPNACQELMQKRHKADFFRRETAEDKVRRANQIVAAVAEAQRIPLPKSSGKPRPTRPVSSAIRPTPATRTAYTRLRTAISAWPTPSRSGSKPNNGSRSAFSVSATASPSAPRSKEPEPPLPTQKPIPAASPGN